ncbi:MAG: hypothetical protein V1911_00675 [Candidatus Micrarchaeota archaeon]
MDFKKMGSGKTSSGKSKKENKKKGFSLFTPLVGTSLVMIGLIVSAVMIENDVRISKSLTASYETSSQVTAARMMSASAIISIIENSEKIAGKIFDNGITISTEGCAGTDEECAEACAGYALAHINSQNQAGGTIYNWLLSPNNSLYEGFDDAVESNTNYEISDSPNFECKTSNDADNAECNAKTTGKSKFRCCVSKAVRLVIDAPSDILSAAKEGDDIIVTVNSQALSSQGEAFAVRFDSKQESGESVTISALPGSASFRLAGAYGHIMSSVIAYRAAGGCAGVDATDFPAGSSPKEIICDPLTNDLTVTWNSPVGDMNLIITE